MYEIANLIIIHSYVKCEALDKSRSLKRENRVILTRTGSSPTMWVEKCDPDRKDHDCWHEITAMKKMKYEREICKIHGKRKESIPLGQWKNNEKFLKGNASDAIRQMDGPNLGKKFTLLIQKRSFWCQIFYAKIVSSHIIK